MVSSPQRAIACSTARRAVRASSPFIPATKRRYRRTLSSGYSITCSGWYPTSRRAVTGRSATSIPPTRTLPAVGGKNPIKQRISVLFPEPFGPSSAATSPRPTLNDTSSTARTGPKHLVRCSTWIRTDSVPRAPLLRLASLARARVDDLVGDDHERAEGKDDDDRLTEADALEDSHHGVVPLSSPRPQTARFRSSRGASLAPPPW